jgi:hypothetical protein
MPERLQALSFGAVESEKVKHQHVRHNGRVLKLEFPIIAKLYDWRI